LLGGIGMPTWNILNESRACSLRSLSRSSENGYAGATLCLVAYYVEWHMRQAWAPILFEEDAPEQAAQLRKSMVAPAQRSEHVQAKEQSKRTQEDLPVHSFGTLLKDLATLVRNWIRPKQAQAASAEFTMDSQPTPVQRRAFQLLAQVEQPSL
jgi:hypothetical protein